MSVSWLSDAKTASELLCEGALFIGRGDSFQAARSSSAQRLSRQLPVAADLPEPFSRAPLASPFAAGFPAELSAWLITWCVLTVHRCYAATWCLRFSPDPNVGSLGFGNRVCLTPEHWQSCVSHLIASI
jgi:hypothetical protein